MLSVTSAFVRAADIRTLEVDEHKGRYFVTLEALLNAPRDNIFTTITNPRLWTKLSHTVSKAEVTAELPDGQRTINVTFEDCILMFCQTVRKSERLRSSSDGHIVTLAIPEQSDFSFAHEHWRVSPQGRKTRVEYQAEMSPSFYIPPLFGPYVLKAKIRSLLLHVTANLESIASMTSLTMAETSH